MDSDKSNGVDIEYSRFLGVDIGSHKLIVSILDNQNQFGLYPKIISDHADNRYILNSVSFSQDPDQIRKFGNSVNESKKFSANSEEDREESQYSILKKHKIDVGEMHLDAPYFFIKSMIMTYIDRIVKFRYPEFGTAIPPMTVSIPSCNSTRDSYYTAFGIKSIASIEDEDANRQIDTTTDVNAMIMGYLLQHVLDAYSPKDEKVLIIDIGHISSRFVLFEVYCREDGGFDVKIERVVQSDKISGTVVDTLVEKIIELQIGSDQYREHRSRLCEYIRKIKHQLSTNRLVSVNVDLIDRDVNIRIDRETLDEALQSMCRELYSVLDEFENDQIDRVELIGGTSRIPLLYDTIQAKYTDRLHRTLNTDEIVSNGCSIITALNYSTDNHLYNLSSTMKLFRKIDHDIDIVHLDRHGEKNSFKLFSKDRYIKTVFGQLNNQLYKLSEQNRVLNEETKSTDKTVGSVIDDDIKVIRIPDTAKSFLIVEGEFKRVIHIENTSLTSMCCRNGYYDYYDYYGYSGYSGYSGYCGYYDVYLRLTMSDIIDIVKIVNCSTNNEIKHTTYTLGTDNLYNKMDSYDELFQKEREIRHNEDLAIRRGDVINYIESFYYDRDQFEMIKDIFGNTDNDIKDKGLEINSEEYKNIVSFYNFCRAFTDPDSIDPDNQTIDIGRECIVNILRQEYGLERLELAIDIVKNVLRKFKM